MIVCIGLPWLLVGSGGWSGVVSADQTDVNGMTLTGFNIPTNVNLHITGNMPVLNLPSKTVLNGTLSFNAGTTDYVNLGSSALQIGASTDPNASINAGAGSTLILSGTAPKWTNFGNITAGDLVIARPQAAPFTLLTEPSASTNINDVLLSPTVDVGMKMTFQANNMAGGNTNVPGSSSEPVVLGNVLVPAAFKTTAIANGANFNSGRAISLTFNLSDINGGSVQAIAGNVQGSTNLWGFDSASSITISGANISKTLGNPLLIGGGATPTTLAATGAISISTGSTAANAIDVENVALQSGQLAANEPTQFGGGLLTGKKQFTVNGSISLSTTSSGGIAIGTTTADNFTNYGAKLSIGSKGTGNITFGNGNELLDMGGNIIVMTKGNVSGGTGNTFQAVGIAKQSVGGIEIGAGTTSSTIAKSFGKPAGTILNGSAFNGTVTIVNGTAPNLHGAVVANTKFSNSFNLGGSTINVAVPVTPAPNPPQVLGGVVQFDGGSAGATVNFGSGNTFETQGAKPVNYSSTEDADVVVDSGEDVEGQSALANSSPN